MGPLVPARLVYPYVRIITDSREGRRTCFRVSVRPWSARERIYQTLKRWGYRPHARLLGDGLVEAWVDVRPETPPPTQIEALGRAQ